MSQPTELQMFRLPIEAQEEEAQPPLTEELRNEQPSELLPSNFPKTHVFYIVLCGFIANFMVFGVAFTFGVFQDYYSASGGPLSQSSHAAVSMIGTVGGATTYICSIFFNFATKHLKTPKMVMLLGSILMSLGFILASFAQTGQVYQFVLSQGLLFGIGASLVYTPPAVCAPPYFTSHRGIALGILFSGSGMGAVTMAPLSRFLISKLGWRWCLRVLGLINFGVTSAVSLLCNQHPAMKGKYRPLKDMFNYKVVDPWSLMLQSGAGFFQSAGYLICLNYMSTYSETLGFTASQGANFIAINNGVNAVFKVIIGHIGDKAGRFNTIIVCSFGSTASVLILWMITTKGTFISFVIIYGVFSGAMVSLFPACLSELFGIGNYQSVSGLMYFFIGCGNLMGAPIAGLLITNRHNIKDQQPTDYRNATIYNGVLLAASTILLILMNLRFTNKLFNKTNH